MTLGPPYVITPEILALVEHIGEAIGRAAAMAAWQDPRLRRINRIRSIQGSLAIEGNALTEGEIAALLEGRPVDAPPRDIQEARNAIRAYDELPGWNPATEAHLLRAHEVMMTALLDAPGVYRQGQVAVVGDGEVRHVGPPAPRVPALTRDLLGWLSGTDAHPLIASSVFHYEFEYIHPFEDGNGRLGRLWQTLILSRWNPLFLHIPWRAWSTPGRRTTTAPSNGVRTRGRALRSSVSCWKWYLRHCGPPKNPPRKPPKF